MHFRVKEVQGTAYITRFYENRLKLETGDFFYPEELPTLELDGTLIYWNDNTGETFTSTTQSISQAVKEPVSESPTVETTVVVPEVITPAAE